MHSVLKGIIAKLLRVLGRDIAFKILEKYEAADIPSHSSGYISAILTALAYSEEDADFEEFDITTLDCLAKLGEAISEVQCKG